MKIMFVNSSLADGGSERAMALIANQMAEIGYDVTMLLLRDKPHVYQLEPSVNLIQLTYSGSSKATILPERLRQIRLHAQEIKPDCIVSFMWDINVMTLAATAGLGVRKVVSERAYPASGERSLTSHLLERIFYRSADAIVYQTEGAREFCPKSLRSRSVVIPNVVAAPQVVPHKGERSRRVVSVGRLTSQKNHLMLIEAFSRFSKVHPGYQLEVYGEGELRGILKARARELGIADALSLPGYVSNVAECINDAAMFVLTSNYEGISNAMAEAMALGVPTICTDCPSGGAALMIRDGENGMLVPVGDVDALASAMCRLANDRMLAECMAGEARKITQKFSSRAIGRKWEEVIRERGC